MKSVDEKARNTEEMKTSVLLCECFANNGLVQLHAEKH